MQKGESWIFNTHLGVWIGCISEITPDEVTLDTCSWVADTGKFSDFVRTGKANEIEFVGDNVIVPRACVKIPFRKPLPKRSK